jgi:hypothetical protein
VHAGVKSTALLFGSATKPWLAAFGASAIGLLGLAGRALGLAPLDVRCQAALVLSAQASKVQLCKGQSNARRPPPCAASDACMGRHAFPLTRLPPDVAGRVVACEHAPLHNPKPSSCMCTGWTTGCGAPFYLGLAAAGSQLAWQVRPQSVRSMLELMTLVGALPCKSPVWSWSPTGDLQKLTRQANPPGW